MEYAEGGDLSTIIKEVKATRVSLRESLIWSFCKMICSGLDHLHSLNVIHKDIKPQNILLTADKTIKLVDFGVSQAYSAHLGFNQVSKAGTPLFTAPELIKKLPYDDKVDAWALGCVLYLLACGEPPFF